MTFAWRLLRGGIAAEPLVRDTGLVGFWNSVPDCKAVTYNDVTYIGFVDDAGKVWAASYNHTTHTASTPTLIATTASPDGVIHNAPAILVRDSDKRIIVAVCIDNAANTPTIFTSTNPEDVSAFGAPQLVGSPVDNPTYPALVQLTGVVNDPIYFFFHKLVSGTFYTGYHKSTDGGATWGSFVSLIKPRVTTATYHRISTDGDTRIDIFTTDTNRVDTPSALYHFEMSGDNLYASDGTLIGACSGGPYFGNAGTLVQDASLGAARPSGWAYDGSGNPACLVLVNEGDGDLTNLVRVARWTGSAWQVDAVTDSNGRIDANIYVAEGAMHKADPDTIWVPRKLGSYFQLYRYTSIDSGAHWAGRPYTGSASDNAAPETPSGATDVHVLWGQGTFTTAANFDFELMALTG